MEGLKTVIVAGPPGSGKTSVMIHAISNLNRIGIKTAVVKIDCLATEDDLRYRELGVPVVVGLSNDICPDHYFVVNFEEMHSWAEDTGANLLIVETAGLCHRCAPGIDRALALCVIDSHSSIKIPEKIGPVLTTADAVIVTKGDSISQAEREVFRSRIAMINRKADLLEVNGLTGAGSEYLAELLWERAEPGSVDQARLRHPMPTAICSYCMGEMRVGSAYQQGVVYKMDFPETDKERTEAVQ
ncbi:MAG: GTP-binding protein [Spirochaetales bacterium]|nr:GTP-binding protein [Spirochaetales bacterium]